MSTMGWRGAFKGDEGWYSAIHRLLGSRRGLCSPSPLHERGTSGNREPILDQEGTQENSFRNRPFTLVISVETLSETHGSWWCHRFLQGLLTGDQWWPLKWDISGHFRSFWSVLSYDIWYSPYSCNPCLSNYLNFELMLTHHFSPLRWPCIRGKKSTV